MIAHIPTYGSDAVGLVCGYLFSAGEPARPIQSGEALRFLRGERASRCNQFLWLHFSLAHNASEKWLRETRALPDSFFEALHQGSRSTRVEHVDGRLLAVINDALYDFSFAASDIATMWLSIDRDIVISARRKPLRSVDLLRAAVNKGERFDSPIALLTHLLHDQCDVLVNIIRTAINTVDGIEDALLADRLELKQVDLGPTRRVLVRLRRLLAPEPGALFRLLNHPPPWITDVYLQDLRQSTEEFSMVLSEMAALLERIKLLQEEMSAQVEQQNNRSLFLLTIVTVLALPINIVAGLLGMNVGGVPLAQHPDGFWLVVAVIAAFTGSAAWLVFRKRRLTG